MFSARRLLISLPIFLASGIAALIIGPERSAAQSASHDTAGFSGSTLGVFGLGSSSLSARGNGAKLTPAVPPDLRGWEHLYVLLQREGIKAPQAAAILSDPRMPAREPLFFALHPSESKHLYRKHNTRTARKNALEFYEVNKSFFTAAEEMYGVPAEVILAILQVETSCGKYTGRVPVFYRLARLASAGAPDNISENYQRRLLSRKNVQLKEIIDRALWLEKEFSPHAAAAIRLAMELGIDPLELPGSSGGAVGIPQFLPGNILRHGADGNKDGKIDIYTAPDAIASVARFLRNSGWHRGKKMSRAQKEKAVWSYNRSKHYIATVLNMSQLLGAAIHPQPKSKPSPAKVRQAGTIQAS